MRSIKSLEVTYTWDALLHRRRSTFACNAIIIPVPKFCRNPIMICTVFYHSPPGQQGRGILWQREMPWLSQGGSLRRLEAVPGSDHAVELPKTYAQLRCRVQLAQPTPACQSTPFRSSPVTPKRRVWNELQDSMLKYLKTRQLQS